MNNNDKMDKKSFDEFVVQFKEHYNERPKETMNELDILINNIEITSKLRKISLFFFIIVCIIFLITSNYYKSLDALESDFTVYLYSSVFIYVGVLIGLRSKRSGIFFLITLLLMGFYMMIPTELYSYLFTDNYLYGNLITVLFIITCISIIALITIACIYNLNDKFKLNKSNFIGILFSYIIPIILIRILKVIMNIF